MNLSGTWALTGEAKAHGLDLPRRPLLRGGIGAIELAARIERLSFGSALRDPLQGPSPDKAGYWSRVLRFQLSL